MKTKLYLKQIICLSILLWGGMLLGNFSAFAQTSDSTYNIVVNIYQDPKTKMAFNWFSNFTGSKVEIVKGTITNHGTFDNTQPKITINDPANQLVNKAVATGLSSGTTYSFRVGKQGLWSDIGTFTTAKSNKDPFSFIYITEFS